MSDRRREVIRMIREDCKADAKKWEGKELTGRNVATMHGETLAIVDALAHIVDSLIEGSDENRMVRRDDVPSVCRVSCPAAAVWARVASGPCCGGGVSVASAHIGYRRF